MQRKMKCSYITPIHKTVDVILELRTCTRIDAPVSGTLEIYLFYLFIIFPQ